MYRDRLAEPGESKVRARRHVGVLLDLNQATLRNWVEDAERAEGQRGLAVSRTSDSHEVLALADALLDRRWDNAGFLAVTDRRVLVMSQNDLKRHGTVEQTFRADILVVFFERSADKSPVNDVITRDETCGTSLGVTSRRGRRQGGSLIFCPAPCRFQRMRSRSIHWLWVTSRRILRHRARIEPVTSSSR